jgi:hypothetical protein
MQLTQKLGGKLYIKTGYITHKIKLIKQNILKLILKNKIKVGFSFLKLLVLIWGNIHSPSIES